MAIWILPKVQLYITVSERRFYVQWWWVAEPCVPQPGEKKLCRGDIPSAIGAGNCCGGAL